VNISTVCVFISCFFFSINTYGQNFKDEKRIYIYDLTLSMFGHNGAPNIGEDVKIQLISAIKRINDPSTEIVIIPFQDDILGIWKELATPSGKKILIQNVNAIDPKKLAETRTNICGAWSKAISLINNKKRNYLFLLTDGIQNSQKGDANCIYKLISDYCQRADTMDVFAYYVMLTAQAQDPKLENIIKDCSHIEFVTGTDINIIELHPQSTDLNLNIPEKEYLDERTMKFDLKGSVVLPPKFQINFKLQDNPYFRLASQSSILDKNGQCKIKLVPLMSDTELLKVVPVQSSINLRLSVDKVKFQRIFASPNEIKLVLNNRREKTLNIEIIQK